MKLLLAGIVIGFLIALGVDYGQGFAIARPVPVGEVLEVLSVLAAATPGAFLCEEPASHTG